MAGRLLAVAAPLTTFLLLATPYPLLAQEEIGQRRLHQQRHLHQQKQNDRGQQNDRGHKWKVPVPLEEEIPDRDSVSEDTVKGDPDALRLYTSDGDGKLRFESADGNFEGRFGGRLMADYTFGKVNSNIRGATGPMENGSELRRARLFTAGSLYDVSYILQLDFSGGVGIKDAYMSIPFPLPSSRIKVGRYKEPFGLEELTSSRFITFMSRSILTEFSPARSNGVALSGSAAADRVNYALGVFRSQTDDSGKSQGDGEWAVTGRFTFAPVMSSDGSRLLHLGAAASRRSLDSSEPTSENYPPEVHLAPDFVTTGNLTGTEDETLVNVESALVYGPLSIQAEYSLRKFGRQAGSSATFHAWYSFISFFLTGEQRPYLTGGQVPYDGGEFGRVFPQSNFTSTGGTGAWEITARFSRMDLNDGDVIGGEASNVTIGATWYLNPSVRVMANYVLASVEDAAGTEGTGGRGHFGSLRFQVDF